MREPLQLRYVSWRHIIMFSVAGSMLKTYFTLPVLLPLKQVTDVSLVSLVLQDSDMESENLSSLIRLSVSDSQKTDSSKDVSFVGI